MKFDIVRAWKDETYRQSLSEEELCSLPENPVGELELTDTDLEAVYGGGGCGCHRRHHGGGNSYYCFSFGCFNSNVCSIGCYSNGYCG